MTTASLDDARLTDSVIELWLERTDPADPSKGRVPQYHYQIVLLASHERVGSLRLRVGEHPSLLFAGHLGYEVLETHRGNGYAERACRLAGAVASAHGLERLIITCEPDNLGSRRTCERLGATLVGIFEVPPDHGMYGEGVRRVCRYEWALGTRW